MEKKGDIINQLALITDLIEKVNVSYVSAKISFNLKDDEFKNVYNYTARKNGDTFVELKDSVKNFSINISNVEVIFNRSNV